MAILLEVRPDAPEKEQILSLREQLEVYLNGLESISPEEIDTLIGTLTGRAFHRWSGGGSGGGGGSVTAYLSLTDKPRIEGILLQGDKSFEDLNLESLTNSELERMLNNDIDIDPEEDLDE